MTDDALFVDDEEPAEGNGFVDQDAVVARDLLREVGDHRIAELADAALAALGLLPGEMAVLRIDRDGDELRVEFFEFPDCVVECDEFGRADERKVHRVEEQYDVSAAQRRKLERLDRIVRHDGICPEVGSEFGDE